MNLSEQISKCSNLSLYWDKYTFIQFKSDFLGEKKQEIPFKILEKVEKTDINIAINHLKERRDNLKEKFKDKVILDLELELNGRLLVGSGSPSMLEVGMTFSRNYGVPIIPSSALKGCFSHYCFKEGIFSDEDFKVIFGEDLSSESENNRGNVIFLDAFPTSKVEFGLDVVNNHFQRYYINGEIPNDWYNPVPVTYLTITNGVFRFTAISIDKISSELSSKIKAAFKEMLSNYGIGSKTNYGYGRFGIDV
ncbi:type III-B CRISPR module RAMP protein Cmr6 [Thermotoga profunda]|uniref:type III-B CRISPR module RAMP protein Cmr6 n=1 Tax=Thermotoga profunda TaxID=1508420 RepID=UPI000596D4B3|nr:type III-B CRISPR module RAMP protein Cmr6 [Thermotoga profunda]